MNAIVTSWSDSHKPLEEMPKRLTWKQQRKWLCKELRRRPKMRFSIFEVTESMLVAKRMTCLVRQGIVRVTGGEFPWTTYEVNAKRTKPKPERPIRSQVICLEMV